MRMSANLVAIFVPFFLVGGLALAQDRPIVAVFGVEVRGVKLSRSVVDNLSEYLGGLMSVRGFQVVPRSQLKERLLAQKKESYRECYDQSCQVALGKELAADRSLSTQVFALGGQCRVMVTLYDLKRSASVGAGKATGKCDEASIVQSLETAVEQLGGAGSGGQQPPVQPPAQHRPQPQPQAPPPPADPTLLTWVPSSAAGIEFTRSEVTVAQYRTCVELGRCSEPQAKSDSRACNLAAGGRDAHPVNCVTWRQASAFCAWAGGRLPTDQEWYAEASDGGKRPYPWGDEPATCGRAIMKQGGEGCGTNLTWPVCSKPAGNSASGLCDMCGNVSEWTSTWGESNYVLRGAALYHVEPSYLKSTAWFPNAVSSGYSIGFRCARPSR